MWQSSHEENGSGPLSKEGGCEAQRKLCSQRVDHGIAVGGKRSNGFLESMIYGGLVCWEEGPPVQRASGNRIAQGHAQTRMI